MLVRIMAVATLLLAVLASGCGLAIHNKWVGEMEPTPHIVLAAIVILLAAVTTVVAFAAR